MKRNISVFIASPSDLSNERNLFTSLIKQLNVGFGDGANVEFKPLGWEDVLASTGRRSQGVINEKIVTCDVFILVSYRRWGQEAPDAKPFSSYTEEEFHLALELMKKNSKPEIFIFFKRVDIESEAKPDCQLKKVMDFRKHLEDTKQVIFRYFNDNKSFIEEIDKHLRAYAKNELPKPDRQQNNVILPLDALKEVEKAKTHAKLKAEEANKARDSVNAHLLKIEALQLQIAEDASNFSKEGQIEYARQKFAALVFETTDIKVLTLAYDFYYRTGDFDSALWVMEKLLSLSDGRTDTSTTAALAYNNLGIVFRSKGELNLAEKMLQKSLSINKKLGYKKGIACSYGNLAIVYFSKGDLDQAENMSLMSLSIHEHLEISEDMAKNYSTLANIYLIRKYFTHTEDMLKKSLAINEALNLKENIANNYGSLGSLSLHQNDLPRAEKMLLKSLSINKTLGRKEAMANDYGNIGILYRSRGQYDKSQDMFQKSLSIDMALGHNEGIARNYADLGILYSIREKYKNAENMLQKSLSIDEAIGNKTGIKSTLHNLEKLHRDQGNIERAEEILQIFLSIK